MGNTSTSNIVRNTSSVSLRPRSNSTSSYSKTPSYYELAPEDEDWSGGHKNTKHTWASLGLEQPLIIAMVGLPARGKSYIVKLTLRYLKWIGFETRVFNVGEYRRRMGHQSADAHFFDSSNEAGKRMREELAMAVQNEMYRWIREGSDESGPRVAVFDATNTTRKRRLGLAQRAKVEKGYLLFVESICDDPETLHRNYELKLQNEDYKGMDKAQPERTSYAGCASTRRFTR